MQYMISFLEGIITFISPCLLPMLPIYITYFAGGGERTTRRTLAGAAGFVLGFTLVFVAMGALAGTVGGFLRGHQTAVNLVSGAVVILFGLGYMGVLRLPFFHAEPHIRFIGNHFSRFHRNAHLPHQVLPNRKLQGCDARIPCKIRHPVIPEHFIIKPTVAAGEQGEHQANQKRQNPFHPFFFLSANPCTACPVAQGWLGKCACALARMDRVASNAPKVKRKRWRLHIRAHSLGKIAFLR